MKKIIIAAIVAASVLTASAQSGTNSPYSQFGFGELTGESSGFNRGMGGVGIGFSEGNQVNYLNPASYSKLDSLTFLFDAGLSLQLTNFEENGKRLNANNANFDYAVAGFRAAKHVGVSFGLIPFTQIGYNYSTVNRLGSQQQGMQYSNTYVGNGGLRKVYVGVGWEPLRNLSLGVNAAYMWGDYSHSLINGYSDTYVNAITKTLSAEVRTYDVNFGLQYTASLTKKDKLTLGLTYGLGHEISTDPECSIVSINAQTQVADTTHYSINKGLRLPHTFGAGLYWSHNNRWKIGFDYTLQKWADVKFPEFHTSGEQSSFTLSNDYFSNRHKFVLGGEYCKNSLSRNFFGRLRYRAGVSYATPYVNIGQNDGPKELSVSAGFGIPIVNSYNNRSILNVSGQWVRQEAKGMLKENTFRICIGITFNERWFQKWKFE